MTQNPLSPLRPSGLQPANSAPYVTAAPEQSGMKSLTPSDIMRLFRRSKMFLVIALLLSVLIAVGLHVLLYNFYPKHVSYGTMKVELKDPSVLGARIYSMDVKLLEKTIKDHIYNINSQAVLSEVISDSRVKKTAWVKSFITNTANSKEVNREVEILAIKRLKKQLRVFNPADSQLISVGMSGYSYEGEAKGDMQVIVATVIDKYLSQERQVAGKISDVDVKVIEATAAKATKKREGREEDISRFMEVNDIGSITSELSNLNSVYQTVSDGLFKNKIGLMMSQDQLDKMLERKKRGVQNVGAEASKEVEQDRIVQGLFSEIISLNKILEVKRKKFGSKHVIIKQIESAILAAETQHEEEVARLTRQNLEASISGLEQNVKSLEDLNNTAIKELEENTLKSKDLGKLQEEYKLKEARVDASKAEEERAIKAYNDAVASKNQAKNLTISLFRSAHDPEMTFPEIWFSPLLTFFFFGSVVGLLFVKEMTDQRFKSPADMRMLPAVKLLGGLPDAGEDPSGSRHIEGAVSQSPSSILSESFRQVRAVIDIAMKERGAKTLMVAAAQNGCGVTQVIANLATSFAYTGYKVCVVDANLHSPGQSRAWQLQSQQGMCECLSGSISLSDAIQQTSVDDVSVLAAGNTAGVHAEIFNREQFRVMVNELKGQFDIVLFDTSPMSITSDGALLATEVDCSALVVLAERETKGLVSRIIRMLNDRNQNFLGVILNGVKASAGGYFQKNYKAYYKYKQVDSQSA